MLELESKNINSFVHHYSIDGIDEKYFHYVEIVDQIDSGEKKWFIIDNFDHTTPIFDNEPNIIVLSNSSCIFIGENNGKSKIYHVQGKRKEKSQHKVIELKVEPKMMVDCDLNHTVIKSDEGVFFFNKNKLKESSDFFDKLSFRQVEGKDIILFEKNIEFKDLNKTITGVVTSDGKIGNFVYDNLDHCMKTVPKISGACEYDLFDRNKLNENMEKQYYKRCQEKESAINRLSRVNRNR